MSDHEDAIAAGVEAWHAVESPRQNVQRIVAAYLSALPPSIVVDGQMVGLEEATDVAVDALPFMSRTTMRMAVEQLLDAGRQLAEEEA